MTHEAPTLIDTIRVENILGECPLWRESDKTLWWTDIEACRLYSLSWPSREVRVRELPHRLGSFAFIAGREDCLLCAFDCGIAVYELETGAIDWIVAPGFLPEGTRFNDGRVDPHGRFWVGSMVEHSVADVSASLFVLDSNGQLEEVRKDIEISNGLNWSPNGDQMYFANSPSGEVERAPFSLSGPGSFASFATVGAGLHPDGAAVDAEGNYWCAVWGSGQVLMFSPQGEKLAAVDVPAPHVTCPCFGGDNSRHLFVTTATADMSAEDRAEFRDAGALFVFETSSTGRLEQRWATAMDFGMGAR